MKNTASTSQFAPYIQDDGSHWEHFYALILELVELDQQIERLSDQGRRTHELARSGFHEIARLRKHDLTTLSEELFQETIQCLMQSGHDHIAELALETRRPKTSRSTVPRAAKFELLNKLERLAESPNPNEAASAIARATELKAKYEIASSDPFDFAMEELFTPVVLSQATKLSRALDEAWAGVKPLGDQHYDSVRVLAELNEKRTALKRLIHQHPVKQRDHGGPVVTRRRA